MKIKSFSVITIVALLIIIAAQIVASFTERLHLINSYSPEPNAYHYEQAIMNGKPDLATIEALFTSVEALPNYNLTNIINSPINIRYYSAIGDETASYEIEQGLPIHIRKTSHSLTIEPGYGLDSLPTASPNWRLAYPFDTDSDSSELHNEPLYIKLDDLFAIARSWIDNNEYIKLRGKQLGMTKTETIRNVILRVDQTLYDSGTYLSSDLYVPNFRMSLFLLSIVVIIVIGGSMFFYVRHKQRS